MKLKAVPSTLGQAPSRLGFAADAGDKGHDARRRIFEPWRKWYSLKAWQDLRLKRFVADNYTCRMCERVTPDPVCDHINAHRGNRRLFFDFDNTQTLCKPCHDGAKQAIEKSGRG